MACILSALLLGLLAVTLALFGGFTTANEHHYLRPLTGASRITQGKPDMMEIMCNGEIKSVPVDAALVHLEKNSNCESVVTGPTCEGSNEPSSSLGMPKAVAASYISNLENS
jgi:hypothetical protein